MQNEQRFNEIITQVLAFAYEADVRGNDPYPGLGYWKALAHNLQQAVMTTAGDLVTEEITRAAFWKSVDLVEDDDEPIQVREMREP